MDIFATSQLVPMAMRITYRRLVAGYRSRRWLVASAIGQVPAEVAEKSGMFADMCDRGC